MSKHIQLTIADPCHENWEQMTQAEKGRFCASCQKQVVDFTNMSDSQLAAFFKKPSEGTVCGRFFQDQLDRSIEIPKKRIPWVKYFFQFALPAFLVSMKVTAQGNVKMGKPAIAVPAKNTKEQKNKRDTIPAARLLIVPTIKAPEQENSSLANVIAARPTNVATCTRSELTQFTGMLGGISVQHFSTPKRHLLKGEVLDEKGHRVSYALIKLDNSYQTYSDRKGKFYLPRWVKDSDSVLINAYCEGYHEKQFIINAKDRRDKIVIHLEPIKKEEIVALKVPIAQPEDTKSIQVLQQELTDNASRFFKLSPNPVQKSNTFYLVFNCDHEETMQLSIVSLSGNIVLIQSKKIVKGYNYLSIKTDPQWAAGIYLVKLSNQKGTVVQQEKLIVQ